MDTNLDSCKAVAVVNYDLSDPVRIADLLRTAILLRDGWTGVMLPSNEKLTAEEIRIRIDWLVDDLGLALDEMIPMSERPDVRKNLDEFLQEGMINEAEPTGNNVQLDPKSAEPEGGLSSRPGDEELSEDLEDLDDDDE